jgi:hypothetical protein
VMQTRVCPRRSRSRRRRRGRFPRAVGWSCWLCQRPLWQLHLPSSSGERGDALITITAGASWSTARPLGV